MPANRKDRLTVDGTVHEIVYLHDKNTVILKGASTQELNVVEGQYILDTPQRRDLVVNELLSREERGEELTSNDLLIYGFRTE